MKNSLSGCYPSIPAEVMPCQVAKFCEMCRLPPRQVATSLKNLCTAVLNNLGDVPLIDLLEDGETSFAQELIGRIRENATRFLAVASELPRVKL